MTMSRYLLDSPVFTERYSSESRNISSNAQIAIVFSHVPTTTVTHKQFNFIIKFIYNNPPYACHTYLKRNSPSLFRIKSPRIATPIAGQLQIRQLPPLIVRLNDSLPRSEQRTYHPVYHIHRDTAIQVI